MLAKERPGQKVVGVRSGVEAVVAARLEPFPPHTAPAWAVEGGRYARTFQQALAVG